jgi:hypothetical protein
MAPPTTTPPAKARAVEKDDPKRAPGPLIPANDAAAEAAARVDAALTRIAEAIGRHIAREHMRRCAPQTTTANALKTPSLKGVCACAMGRIL